jgi:hypothetical protein
LPKGVEGGFECEKAFANSKGTPLIRLTTGSRGLAPKHLGFLLAVGIELEADKEDHP